jgi:hypothetical protein
VYVATAGLLVVTTVVSVLTAGRNRYLAYRLCAPIFLTSAVLLAAAATWAWSPVSGRRRR